MSFLKNIMSTFVEFKEDEAKPEAKESIKTVQEPTQQVTETIPADPVIIPAAAPAVATSSRPGAMTDYHKYFEDLIEEANAKNTLFQGTDFKEFIDSKIDVEAIADEPTRYKTAFNVLKRTGLTKEKLVLTGNQYINLIDTDLKGFTDAFAQQYKKDVEQNELLLQQKATELKQLNEKIAVLTQEIQQVSQEITGSKEKLTTNKEAFLQAGENKKHEIQAELQKIEQYF
jgi:hypothetical protein